MEQNHTHAGTRQGDPAGLAPFIFLFIVIGTFFVWCCCVGAWLARLWYYDGQLHKKFRKYDIQPIYIRERLAKEQELKRRESQKIVEITNWSQDVTTMSFERVQEFDSASLRQRIFEDKRISRLPAFEQDDGGDGSEFPDMPVDMTAKEYNEQHFPAQSTSFWEIGLSKMPGDDWLTYHNNEQMMARDQILDDQQRRENCIDMRPGREVEEMCGELWQEVAKFIRAKHPARFWEQTEDGVKKLFDQQTGEAFPLEGPFGWLTLDTMARLVCEDFCIFKKSPFSGQYTLMAGATCFPSGWRFKARIGHSVDSQQETILPWENLTDILSYMGEHGDNSAYERHVIFIQTARPYETDLVKKYFVQEGKDFFSGNISFLQPETLHARIERQMFRKLPATGAIVMTTRMQIESLVLMEEDKLRQVGREIRSWPAHIGRLKGRDLWGRAVLGYIEEFPMAHDDESVFDAGDMTEEEEEEEEV